MARLPVTDAAHLALNVNDLVTIHRYMCDGLRRELDRAGTRPARIDPGVWVLLRWVERSAIATGDCPCEVSGHMMNQRELLQTVNTNRATA